MQGPAEDENHKLSLSLGCAHWRPLSAKRSTDVLLRMIPSARSLQTHLSHHTRERVEKPTLCCSPTLTGPFHPRRDEILALHEKVRERWRVDESLQCRIQVAGVPEVGQPAESRLDSFGRATPPAITVILPARSLRAGVLILIAVRVSVTLYLCGRSSASLRHPASRLSYARAQAPQR
jgi:hypothetical protein